MPVWVFEVALCAYGALVLGLFLFQRRLLFRPGRGRPDLGVLGLAGVCEAMLTTKDGLLLRSWYLSPAPGRPVIAYFHGNGGHIGYRAERLRRFAAENYGVLMLEYRGYGGNPGSPSEAGLCADAEAALDYLKRQAIAPNRLVLWGESLGSAVAVAMAARHVVGALVLEAPFTSIAAAAQLHYPFVPAALLVRDRFDSLARIAGIGCPLLVLHGGRDRIVPIRHGRALLAAAPPPKEGWFEPLAEHEDLVAFGALEVAIVFIERHISAAAAKFVAAGPNFA